MSIEDRIIEANQKFEQAKAERDNHIQQAEDLLVEMTKLQGEFRILQELKAERAALNPTEDPAIITATPEKAKK